MSEGYDREAAQELQGYIELEAYDAVPRTVLEELQARLDAAVAVVEASDAVFQWLLENYPKAFDELPTPLYHRLRAARDARVVGATRSGDA